MSLILFFNFLGDDPKLIMNRQSGRGALTVEAPRFGKGKGSGAKEDSSPASNHIIS